MTELWEEELSEKLRNLRKINKQEVVDFAQNSSKKLCNRQKLRGENENLIRVENQGITPVKINREAQSEFLTEILHQNLQKLPEIH